MFENGIAVIGLGYIGLPTSAAIATQGVLVKGVDVDPRTVDVINRGLSPIIEPELDAAVARAHSLGRLAASVDVPEADAFLIAVPTPFKADNQPDLSYVQAAAEAIAPRLRGGEVVILESTSPPGTTRNVSKWIAAARPDLRLPHEHPVNPDIHIAHCPERVLPGRIMIELVTNDRVIGGITPDCAHHAAKVYELFCKGEILFTNAESAEMAKLVENSFRDVNIAFANELADVSDHMGLDVWEIIRLANRHPRVNILNPGPGVGGHCIAVDPWFIVAAAPEQARLIRTAREVNDARPATVARQIQASAAENSAPIACLGLAFKADINDLRESPSIEVTQLVASANPSRRILVVEPHVSELPTTISSFSNVELVPLEDALQHAETIALLVDHLAFTSIRLGELEGKGLIDTRGLWTHSNA